MWLSNSFTNCQFAFRKITLALSFGLFTLLAAPIPSFANEKCDSLFFSTKELFGREGNLELLGTRTVSRHEHRGGNEEGYTQVSVYRKWNSGRPRHITVVREVSPHAIKISEYHGVYIDLKERYLVTPFADPDYYLYYHAYEGTLSMDLLTGSRRPHQSEILRARDYTHDVLDNWPQIHTIKSKWYDGTNLQMYQDAIRAGKSPEEAAMQTWTGRLVFHNGFTKVQVQDEKSYVTATFLRN